jgi:hypothetical protein
MSEYWHRPTLKLQGVRSVFTHLVATLPNPPKQLFPASFDPLNQETRSLSINQHILNHLNEWILTQTHIETTRGQKCVHSLSGHPTQPTKTTFSCQFDPLNQETRSLSINQHILNHLNEWILTQTHIETTRGQKCVHSLSGHPTQPTKTTFSCQFDPLNQETRSLSINQHILNHLNEWILTQTHIETTRGQKCVHSLSGHPTQPTKTTFSCQFDPLNQETRSLSINQHILNHLNEWILTQTHIETTRGQKCVHSLSGHPTQPTKTTFSCQFDPLNQETRSLSINQHILNHLNEWILTQTHIETTRGQKCVHSLSGHPTQPTKTTFSCQFDPLNQETRSLSINQHILNHLNEWILTQTHIETTRGQKCVHSLSGHPTQPTKTTFSCQFDPLNQETRSLSINQHILNHLNEWILTQTHIETTRGQKCVHSLSGHPTQPTKTTFSCQFDPLNQETRSLSINQHILNHLNEWILTQTHIETTRGQKCVHSLSGHPTQPTKTTFSCQFDPLNQETRSLSINQHILNHLNEWILTQTHIETTRGQKCVHSLSGHPTQPTKTTFSCQFDPLNQETRSLSINQHILNHLNEWILTQTHIETTRGQKCVHSLSGHPTQPTKTTFSCQFDPLNQETRSLSINQHILNHLNEWILTQTHIETTRGQKCVHSLSGHPTQPTKTTFSCQFDPLNQETRSLSINQHILNHLNEWILTQTHIETTRGQKCVHSLSGHPTQPTKTTFSCQFDPLNQETRSLSINQHILNHLNEWILTQTHIETTRGQKCVHSLSGHPTQPTKTTFSCQPPYPTNQNNFFANLIPLIRRREVCQ